MTKTDTAETTPESHEFQAEVARLLHLMVHSVYSEAEVFLRELVSNASDACDKLRYAALTDAKLAAGDTDYRVGVLVDKKAKTITVADNGIGMDHQELIDNLGTIARSGTEAFTAALDAAKAGDIAPIGQFGVGFYSSFIIADKVDVTSVRAGADGCWHWSSDGSGTFSLAEGAVGDMVFPRGTTIRLHVRKEHKEFLETDRLSAIVRKYSDHIPLPVEVSQAGSDDLPETVNAAKALWTKPKAEVTAEQYADVYKSVSRHFDDPWKTIHYKAEGRQEYSVLLFLPTERPFDLFDPARKGAVKLYVRRVFITDDAELLPPYLRFVTGIVDSEDMPLNLSREMLQNNPLVTRIRGALTKRVLSELGKAAKKDTESFDAFLERFGPVLKEGLYEDADRRETLLKLVKFKTSTSDGMLRSLADYVEGMGESQTAIYYIAGGEAETVLKNPQLEGYRARGIEVLLLTDPVDSFWVNAVGDFDGKPLKSVTHGSDDLEAMAAPEAEGKEDEPAASEGDMGLLIQAIKQVLGEDVADVKPSTRLVDSPCCLVAGEGGYDLQLERLLRAQGQGGLVKKVLEINPKHPLIKTLADKSGDAGFATFMESPSRLLLDQALIIEGEPLPDAAGFATRMSEVMAKALG